MLENDNNLLFEPTYNKTWDYSSKSLFWNSFKPSDFFLIKRIPKEIEQKKMILRFLDEKDYNAYKSFPDSISCISKQ